MSRRDYVICWCVMIRVQEYFVNSQSHYAYFHEYNARCSIVKVLLSIYPVVFQPHFIDDECRLILHK